MHEKIAVTLFFKTKVEIQVSQYIWMYLWWQVNIIVFRLFRKMQSVHLPCICGRRIPSLSLCSDSTNSKYINHVPGTVTSPGVTQVFVSLIKKRTPHFLQGVKKMMTMCPDFFEWSGTGVGKKGAAIWKSSYLNWIQKGSDRASRKENHGYNQKVILLRTIDMSDIGWVKS